MQGRLSASPHPGSHGGRSNRPGQSLTSDPIASGGGLGPACSPARTRPAAGRHAQLDCCEHLLQVLSRIPVTPAAEWNTLPIDPAIRPLLRSAGGLLTPNNPQPAARAVHRLIAWKNLLEAADGVAPAGVRVCSTSPTCWLASGDEPRDRPRPAGGPGGSVEERLFARNCAHLHAGPYARPFLSQQRAPAAAPSGRVTTGIEPTPFDAPIDIPLPSDRRPSLRHHFCRFLRPAPAPSDGDSGRVSGRLAVT